MSVRSHVLHKKDAEVPPNALETTQCHRYQENSLAAEIGHGGGITSASMFRVHSAGSRSINPCVPQYPAISSSQQSLSINFFIPHHATSLSSRQSCYSVPCSWSSSLASIRWPGEILSHKRGNRNQLRSDQWQPRSRN